MASALAELAILLQSDRATTGVVSAIVDGYAYIATSNGMIQAKPGDGVMIGSRVRVANGIARVTIAPTQVYAV